MSLILPVQLWQSFYMLDEKNSWRVCMHAHLLLPNIVSYLLLPNSCASNRNSCMRSAGLLYTDLQQSVPNNMKCVVP